MALHSKDETYLNQALAQAILGRGQCAPNPAVGAVLVKNDNVLASGYHKGPGLAHAEAEVLLQSPEQNKDATLYITLEPCNHFGRTPPCTDLIINSGVARVVYGYQDVNPVVAGKSMQVLQNAGIECQQFSISTISNFYQSYQHWHKTHLPFVTAKIALSLDGKIAANNFQRVQITGNEAQQFTHQMRLQSDAILTTVNTIIADDPLLNVRINGTNIAKKVYLLDRHNKLPEAAKINTSAKELQCIAKDDLLEILQLIGADGVHDLWVEAGARLLQSLLQKKLVNRLYIYISLKVLGEKAVSAFAAQSDYLQQAKHIHWQPLGNDVVAQLDF